MSVDEHYKSAVWFSKARMETLVDGFFAFSMTLLVASLIFPNIVGDTSNSLTFDEIVTKLAYDLVYYAIAFYILATYWILHHLHYYFIVRPNLTSIRLMIVALFFIALMPISTAICALYSNNPLSEIPFEANLFAIGFFYLLHLWYATKNMHLLDKNLHPLAECLLLRQGIVTPTVSIAGIILAIAGFNFSILIYLTVPIFESLIYRLCRKKFRD